MDALKFCPRCNETRVCSSTNDGGHTCSKCRQFIPANDLELVKEGADGRKNLASAKVVMILNRKTSVILEEFDCASSAGWRARLSPLKEYQ